MTGEKYHDINQTFFQWAVSETGYQWIPAETVNGTEELPLVLLPNPGPDGTMGMATWSKMYKPLEDEPALFLEFAELSPTEEDVLAFADKYGLLIGNCPIDIETNAGSIQIYGDASVNWFTEIDIFKNFMDLWCTSLLAKGEDVKNSVMTQAEANEELKNGVGLAFHERKKAPVLGDMRADIYQSITLGPSEEPFLSGVVDPVNAAGYIVSAGVNWKLRKERVSPQIVHEIDKGGVKYVPYLIPECLIGAIWLQFYQWIVGERSHKRCRVCGLWADTTGLHSNWKEHAECGARRRAKEAYERKKKLSNKQDN